MFHVSLCRFRRMMIRMMRVSTRGVSVMRSSFMISRFVVPRGVAMMLGRALQMFRCLMMVLGCLFRHSSSWHLLTEYCRMHGSALL
jgi:hypothetical protein